MKQKRRRGPGPEQGDRPAVGWCRQRVRIQVATSMQAGVLGGGDGAASRAQAAGRDARPAQQCTSHAQRRTATRAHFMLAALTRSSPCLLGLQRCNIALQPPWYPTPPAAQSAPPNSPCLRLSCFCGRMICTLWLSPVEGMGWLRTHMARTTRAVLRTCGGGPAGQGGAGGGRPARAQCQERG